MDLKANFNSNNVLEDYSILTSEMHDSNIISGRRENWEYSVIRCLCSLYSDIVLFEAILRLAEEAYWKH